MLSLYSLTVVKLASRHVLPDQFFNLDNDIQIPAFLKICRLNSNVVKTTNPSNLFQMIFVKDKRLEVHQIFKIIYRNTKWRRLRLIITNLRSLIFQHTPRWSAVRLSILMADFFNEAGYYDLSSTFYTSTFTACQSVLDQQDYLVTGIKCLQKLLRAQIHLGDVETPKCTFEVLVSLVKQVTDPAFDWPALYSDYIQYSIYSDQLSQALFWSQKALGELSNQSAVETIIDTLLSVVNAYLRNVRYKEAELIIKFVMWFTKRHFGVNSVQFNEVLYNYFIFLKYATVSQTYLKYYQIVVKFQQTVYGRKSLRLARTLLMFCELNYETGTKMLSMNRWVDMDMLGTDIMIILETHGLKSRNVLYDTNELLQGAFYRRFSRSITDVYLRNHMAMKEYLLKQLNVYERIWGLDCPHAVRALSELAHMYACEKDYRHARILYKLLIIRMLNSKGPYYARSIMFIYHLAYVCHMCREFRHGNPLFSLYTELTKQCTNLTYQINQSKYVIPEKNRLKSVNKLKKALVLFSCQ